MKTILWMSLVLIILFAVDLLDLDGFAKWFGLVYLGVGVVMFVREFRNARR
jgi:hypothetical protein